jgi:UDP-glucose 4-epimerase
MQEPAVYYANNVANTIGLLNSAVTHGVKNFIFSSSSTVYGSAEQFPTTESTPTNPISPYGRSKQMVETMLSDYEAAYGIRCVALRYFNAAGAMPDNSHGYTQDPATHLIPIVARALANDQCITVFGDDYDTKDGTCERDYTHVCDIAQAHIAAMTMLDTDNSTGGVFNIGMGSPASVLDVLAAFEQVTGKPPVYTFAGRRTGDAAKTYADITLATGALGWAPEHTLEDIVRHAWAWETKKRKK